jgi:hypothetical protein
MALCAITSAIVSASSVAAATPNSAPAGVASTTKARAVAIKSPTGKLTMNALLPLFYRDLVAFDTAQHGKLAFPVAPPDYRFAAQTNIIPLLINEIPFALRHYPLVFLPGDDNNPPTLAALVGIGDGKNQFVGADGQWRPNTYIPAWVRRYPFLAVNTEAQADPLLALDPTAEWLNSQGGERFVDAAGKPTPRMEFVIAYQNEFQEMALRTQNIAKALSESGVLEEGNLRFAPGTADQAGEAREIKGFFIVSEQKLRALSAKAIAKLHQADALGLAYAQLFSVANLSNVVALPPASLPPATGAAPTRLQ